MDSETIVETLDETDEKRNKKDSLRPVISTVICTETGL
jgi:hypothetical protein